MLIIEGRPKAKAIIWVYTDTEKRKLGEQTGLETPVVHDVNDECSYLDFLDIKLTR